MSDMKNNALECPEWLSQWREDLPDGIKPRKFWEETVNWLDSRGLLHNVFPGHIEEFAILSSRSHEAEMHISELMPKYYESPFEYADAMNTMIDVSLNYAKHSLAAWDAIWKMAYPKSGRFA